MNVAYEYNLDPLPCSLGCCTLDSNNALELWKWRRENPQIAVKVEAHEAIEAIDQSGAIHYELRNRGGKSTTIEEIMLVKYAAGIWGLLRNWEHIEYTSRASRETVKLPMVLKPGELWTGYSVIAEERPPGFKMDKVSLIQSGKLFL